MKKLFFTLLASFLLFTSASVAYASEVWFNQDTYERWGKLWYGNDSTAPVDKKSDDEIWVWIDVPESTQANPIKVKGLNLTIHDHDEGGEFQIFGYSYNAAGQLVSVVDTSQTGDRQLIPQKDDDPDDGIRWKEEDIDTLGEDSQCGSAGNPFYTERYHPEHWSTSPDHTGCLRIHPVVAGDPGVDADAKLTNSRYFPEGNEHYYSLSNIPGCEADGCRLNKIAIKLTWNATAEKIDDMHYHIGRVKFLTTGGIIPPTLSCTTDCVEREAPNRTDNKLHYTWTGGSGYNMIFNITQDGNSFDPNTGTFWNKVGTTGNALSIYKNQFTAQGVATGGLTLVPGTKYKAYVFDDNTKLGSNTIWCTLKWCEDPPITGGLKCNDTCNSDLECTSSLGASYQCIQAEDGVNRCRLKDNPNTTTYVESTSPSCLKCDNDCTGVNQCPTELGCYSNTSSCRLMINPSSAVCLPSNPPPDIVIPEYECNTKCSNNTQCGIYKCTDLADDVNDRCRLPDDTNTPIDESSFEDCNPNGPGGGDDSFQISGEFRLTTGACNETQTVTLDSPAITMNPATVGESIDTFSSSFTATYTNQVDNISPILHFNDIDYECASCNPETNGFPLGGYSKACYGREVDSPTDQAHIYLTSIADNPVEPWWQTWGGLVYGHSSIRSELPVPKVSPYCEADDNCDPHLISYANGPTGSILKSAGIPATSRSSITPKTGNPSIIGWLTVNSGNPYAMEANMKDGIEFEDFDYFKQKVDLNGVETIDTNSISGLNISSGTVRGDARVFHRDGNLTFNPNNTWQVGNNKVIVFVSGDLTFSQGGAKEQLITVGSDGFLAFIVSGNVKFDASVGNSSPDDTTSNIEAVVVANGNITTKTYGSGNDNRLVLQGSYVGWGDPAVASNPRGISLNRSIDGIDSRTNPSELVIHRPDFVTNTPDILRASTLNWQEVN